MPLRKTSCIDLILTNQKQSFKDTASFDFFYYEKKTKKLLK